MRVPLAREALDVALPLAAATAAALAWAPWLSPLPAALLVGGVWFFRDPERTVPPAEDAVVSPADGHVLWVREVEEPRFLEGPSVAISIFLGVTDVHINRAPFGGQVVYRDHVPGRFDPAYGAEVGETNERAYTGMQTAAGRILLVQIAGRIARRIVTRVRPGDEVERGQRIGLIRFGSCTQVYLPPGSPVLIKPGERVRGGETVIATLRP